MFKCVYLLDIRILPRSFVAPFFVILKPGDEGVEGAVVIPLPCPICERDDRLFAEGDNVPLIFPKSGEILSDDNAFL